MDKKIMDAYIDEFIEDYEKYPEGNIHEWEGLSELFVAIVEKEPVLLQIDRINFWYKATKKVMENYKK